MKKKTTPRGQPAIRDQAADKPTTKSPTVKPTHKAVKAYYDTLKNYGTLYVEHETAIRSAFQTLLADAARSHGWTLVPEQRIKVGGETVIPDGTLRDEYLPRGYWEAKDTNDDLDVEIERKAAKGYPLTNTIFEDTRRAVLFQAGQAVFDADLTQPQQLADLLNEFFTYAEPDIQCFEQIVTEFKERVPELGASLASTRWTGNPTGHYRSVSVEALTTPEFALGFC